MCSLNQRRKYAEVAEVTEDIADVTNGKRPFPPEEVIFGTSRALNDLRKRLERVARTDVPTLIREEAGSGKGILAKHIHRRYPGEATLFHKVMPGDRSGWLRNASFMLPGEDSNAGVRYSQAVPGKQACIGSLFFEEVAEFNPTSQQRLARLLHDGQPSVIDPAECAPSLFRVICSSKDDPEQQMKMGCFREEKIAHELTARAQQASTREFVSGTVISLKSLAKQEARELERNIILETLRETKWNRKQAACALKISYRTFLYKIKEAGVPPKRIAAKREKEH